jgi:hypothetical protein
MEWCQLDCAGLQNVERRLGPAGLIIRLFRVFCEEVFTTEAPSSQRSENFLIKNSLVRVLRAFAMQSPSPTSQECLKSRLF